MHLPDSISSKQKFSRSLSRKNFRTFCCIWRTQLMTSTRSSQNQSMIYLEPAEMLAVLKAAKAKGARELAMILLAYKHGMRASEVCNTRLQDLDTKNGNIIIERLKGSLRT